MSLNRTFSRKASKINKDIATWSWRSKAAKIARAFHEKKLKEMKEAKMEGAKE